MECRYAYKMNGVNYVMCKALGTPNSSKMQDTAKYMCGHQRFCGKVQDCSLLPTWRDCRVRKEEEEKDKLNMNELAEKVAVARVEREAKSKRKK